MSEADRIFAAVNAQNLKCMEAVLVIAAERDKLVGINARLLSALEGLLEEYCAISVFRDEDKDPLVIAARASLAEGTDVRTIREEM